MIVCHCHGVTDREVRAAVREGACRVAEVARRCRAGTSCGGCAPLVAEIVCAERRRLEVVETSGAALGQLEFAPT